MESKKTGKKRISILAGLCAFVMAVTFSFSTLDVQATTQVGVQNLRWNVTALTDDTWDYAEARRISWDEVPDARKYIVNVYHKKNADAPYWNQKLYATASKTWPKSLIDSVFETNRGGIYYFTVEPLFEEGSGKVGVVTSSSIFTYVPYKLSIGGITDESSITPGVKRNLSVTIINNEPYEKVTQYPEGEDRTLTLSYYKKGSTTKTVIGTINSNTSSGNVHKETCSFSNFTLPAAGDYVLEAVLTVDTKVMAVAQTETYTATKDFHVHNYESYQSDGTNHWKACSLCGGKNATATHTYGPWTIDTKATNCTATSGTAAGSKHRNCTVCNYKQTAIAADGSHNWNSTYTIDKAATCYSNGSKSIHCKECSATKDTTTIARVSCNESAWSSISDTRHKRSCSICGGVTTAPHTFGSWVIDSVPTDCTATSGTQAGSKHRNCSGCGYKQTAIVADGSHNWNSTYTVDKASTCTVQGSKSIHCKDCSKTKSTTAIALNTHNYGAWTTADSSNHKHTCSSCGNVETAAHSGGTATCKATAVCTGCGTSYGSKNTANHTGGTQVVNAKEATIEAEGYTGDTVCKGCGATVKKGSVIDKLESSNDDDVTPPSNENDDDVTPPSNENDDNQSVPPADDTNKKDDSNSSADKENTNNNQPIVPSEKPNNSNSSTTPTDDADGQDTKDEGENKEKDNNANEISLNAGTKVTITKNKLTIKWGKVKEADGYEVYVAKAGANLNKKLVKTVNNNKKTSITFRKIGGKKVNTTQTYQVKVKAFETVNGKKTYIGEGLTFYVTGNKNKTYTNAKKVKVSTKTITLKTGKQKTVKASVVKVTKSKKTLPAKYAKAVRFLSSNEDVATVNKNGKIKAVGKGSCYIYAIAQNGTNAKIKIKVK